MATASDLEATLLGPVLPGRDCGGCTVCCTTLRVDTPELRKPAGEPCVHLGRGPSGGGGCTIHAVRPAICRTWFCGWRRSAALIEQDRPDRSGLLVSLAFERQPRNCFEGVAIVVRLLGGSSAVADGTAARVLDALCDRLVPVWFSDGPRRMLMHPDAEIARHVIDGSPPPPHLAGEVAAWRAQYGHFAPADPPGSPQ